MAGLCHTTAIVVSYLSAVEDNGGSNLDEQLSSSCAYADNEYEGENEEENEAEELW